MNKDQDQIQNRADHLFTGDEEAILTNLEGLREKGNITSLGAILDHLTTQPSPQVKSKILSLIADIKIPGAAAIIAEFTFACSNPTIQQELISACWQSRLDFSSYFNRYIDLAIAGEMLLVLDVISLVEECCEKTTAQQMKVAISSIKKNLKGFDNQKQLLMSDLVGLLEEREKGLK